MSKLWKIGGIFIGVLALLVAVGSVWTLAQDDGAPPAPETPALGEEGEFAPAHHRPHRRSGLLAEIIEPEAVKTAVADALGISVEELEQAREDGVRLPELADEQGVPMADVVDAVQDVVETAVDEALANDDITEEQAERIRQGLERVEQAQQMKEAYDQAFADELGITVEELHDARAAARQQLIDDGLIPEDAPARLPGAGGGFGPFGGGRPHGQGGGLPFFGGPDNPPAPPAGDAGA
jgi:hypothetical protein